MRTIGIDLAITGQHQAVSVDEYGEPLGPPFRFGTDPLQLDRLLSRTRGEADPSQAIRVVMEPTGLSWLPLASYCIQRGATVFLVNSQRIADLRAYYRKHANSDQISARVLARLPWTDPDALHPLHLANADYLTGQRWCRQQEELAESITAVKNRVQAWERAFWPGLEQFVHDLWTPWMRHWRQVYYDPWRLEALETGQLAAFLVASGADADQAHKLAAGLQVVAHRAVTLFGAPQQNHSPYVVRLSSRRSRLRHAAGSGAARTANLDRLRRGARARTAACAATLSATTPFPPSGEHQGRR
ncbi:MAG: IS110 family transposase [Chloroflexi bacterium]|nr:IS110 family transposase [Chloroflexota bacterium]